MFERACQHFRSGLCCRVLTFLLGVSADSSPFCTYLSVAYVHFFYSSGKIYRKCSIKTSVTESVSELKTGITNTCKKGKTNTLFPGCCSYLEYAKIPCISFYSVLQFGSLQTTSIVNCEDVDELEGLTLKSLCCFLSSVSVTIPFPFCASQ